MDILQQIIGNPFFWGLGLGAFLCFFTWRDGMTKRQLLRQELRKLKKEMESQNDHLGRHLKINQKGVENLEQQVEELKKQNNNLKDTVAMYKQKPSADERRLVHVYDMAIRKLNEKVPGFAAAWENAYKEADAEVEAAETGLTRLVKRFVGGSAPVLETSGGQPELMAEDAPTPAEDRH